MRFFHITSKQISDEIPPSDSQMNQYGCFFSHIRSVLRFQHSMNPAKCPNDPSWEGTSKDKPRPLRADHLTKCTVHITVYLSEETSIGYAFIYSDTGESSAFLGPLQPSYCPLNSKLQGLLSYSAYSHFFDNTAQAQPPHRPQNTDRF